MGAVQVSLNDVVSDSSQKPVGCESWLYLRKFTGTMHVCHVNVMFESLIKSLPFQRLR